MTAAEIKEYLGMCIELEKEVYTQNRAIAQLRYNISLLGNYRIINEPTAPGKTVNENGINTMFWGMILAVTGGISIVIALPISSDFFLISGVLALLIGGGCWFFGRIIYDEDYKKAVRNYNKKAEQYKVEILNDAKRVDAERIKKAVLQSNMNTLSEANKNREDACSNSMLKMFCILNIVTMHVYVHCMSTLLLAAVQRWKAMKGHITFWKVNCA